MLYPSSKLAPVSPNLSCVTGRCVLLVNRPLSSRQFLYLMSQHSRSQSCDPLGQRLGSRALASSGRFQFNSPRFTDFRSFCAVSILFTGLPYGNTAIPVGKWVEFLRFIFFRVGKSLACHSPGKWCLWA